MTNFLTNKLTPFLNNLNASGPINLGPAMPLPEIGIVKTPFQLLPVPGAMQSAAVGGEYSIDDDEDDYPDTESIDMNDGIFEESAFGGRARKRKEKRQERRQEKRIKRLERRNERKTIKQQMRSDRKGARVAARLDRNAAKDEQAAQAFDLAWNPDVMVSPPSANPDFTITPFQPMPSGLAPFDDQSDFQELPESYLDSIYSDAEESFLGMGRAAKIRREVRRRDKATKQQQKLQTKQYKNETDRVRAEKGLAKETAVGSVVGSLAGVASAFLNKGQGAASESGGYYPEETGEDSPRRGKGGNNTMVYVAIAIVVAIGGYLVLKKK